MEYVKNCCNSSSCLNCNESVWVGSACHKIPKPMPDYSADGMHYISVLNTPSEINGAPRTVDDFQSTKQVKYHLQKLSKLKKGQQNSKTFKDYDWTILLKDGLVKKLRVTELDKYLSHFGLCKSLHLKKTEKVTYIFAHIASTMLH